MAAATDIIVADGQGTPVNHTFTPFRKDGNLVEWQERTTPATPLGFYSLAITGNMPKNGSTVSRLKLSLSLPRQLVDAYGVYTYPDIGRFNADIIIPVAWPQALRNDVAAYYKNIAAHTVIQNAIKNLDFPF